MARWPLWLKIVPAVVGLLLFALLALLFGPARPSQTTVTVVATTTPTPVVVVVTATRPPATATPPPPTPTRPAATATPTPPPAAAPPAPAPAPAAPAGAEAPKEGPSPEVAAYLEYMQPRMQRLSQVFERFGQQSDRLSREPSLLDDPAWRAETAEVLTTLKAVGVELQGYGAVPAAAAPLDGTLKAIGRDLVAAADEFSGGLEAKSIPRINEAVRRLQSVSDRTQQATEQFNALARGG